MLHRLIHYLTALITLSGMSIVYQNLVTPWMTPPQIQQVPLAEVSGPSSDKSLHELFPPGSWQRGECRQLQTKDMTLLFRDLEQKTDDQLRLSPVTVIVGRGMSATKDPNPVIIEAVDGAEITFSRALNLLSGSSDAPPIDHGKIQGQVRIRRAESDQDQPFEIRTSNVGIRNRKVWTPDAIDMQVGGARCIGSDLTIHLSAPATTDGPQGDALLDRIELIYLDQLTLPIPGDESATPGSAASEDQGIVSINCDGRLEYDFAIDQLSLHDAVSLVRQVASLPSDEFHCDLLKVRFNDPTNRNKQRNGPLDWLVEIIATGSPASIKAGSYDTEILADQIEFHAGKGLLQTYGKAGVQIRRAGITARLANLVYQFDTKNPEALGAIDIQGAGIVKIRNSDLPLRELKWRDRFKMFPVTSTPNNQSTNNQLGSEIEFQVDGDFQAWMTDGGQIQANSMAGILKSVAKSPQDQTFTLVPDRLITNGNVRIDTATVSAETQQLFVQFVAEPNPKPATSDGSVKDSSRFARQWVTQPPSDTALTAPVARARPIIKGDTINVQLRQNEEGLSVMKLSIAGSVEAEHQLLSGGQVLPARFTGQLLQLIDGGGDDVLEIVGGADAPARFDFGDGFFVGPKIQISPSDNHVSINEAGEFRIPTAALPTGLDDQPNQNLKWTSPPHCRWKGEMRFDGRTALLTGGVDITASLINNDQPWDVVMRGDRLQVDLVEGVQIRDVSAMRTATIRSVSLIQASDQPVIVQAVQRAADGIRESKHVLQATKFTFSPVAGGGLVAQGPGWYRGWFVPQDNPSRFRIASHNQSSTDQPNDQSMLHGTHLLFSDTMRGDMSARTLDFLKGVRVGIRPVSDWDETFDAASMDSISSGESTLDCDQLRFAVSPSFVNSDRIHGLPIPWEVEASSGVVFRTRNERGLIEGTASRAGYTSGKQLFTADGAPNRPAIVRHTRPDGSKGIDMRVRTTTIHLGTMTIVNQVLEGFSIPSP